MTAHIRSALPPRPVSALWAGHTLTHTGVGPGPRPGHGTRARMWTHATRCSRGYVDYVDVRGVSTYSTEVAIARTRPLREGDRTKVKTVARSVGHSGTPAPPGYAVYGYGHGYGSLTGLVA